MTLNRFDSEMEILFVHYQCEL